MKTKHLFLSAALVLGVVTANAQTGNFGIGVSNPTNKLHVKPTTVDPIRAEGLQTATDAEVVTTDANGVLHKRSFPTTTTGPTNGTASDGTINTCGCSTMVTITPEGAITAGDPGTDSDVTTAQLVTALSNPAVCDIAIQVPNINTGTGNVTRIDMTLPPASNYTGRRITFHPALPYQMNSTSGGRFEINVLSAAGKCYEIPGEVSTTQATLTGTAVGSASYLSGTTSFPINFATTVSALSIGEAWVLTQDTGICYVYKLVP